MAVIVDSSVWIEYLDRDPIADLERWSSEGELVLPPLVVAELFSGDLSPRQRVLIGEVLQDRPLHQTDLGHWMRVGELRRMLASRGVNATIPDAHIAQCALDLDATLFSRDAIFASMANFVPLRLR